ncbi:DEAD/DEAH box helicase [Pseudomonas citronellolis]|uniref:DEAD/DEAH box helicase n=1 Tax=Pseudomonas citronellolis TaxID=53408 RepID=UPI0023E418B5|nr:AAA domain-containing protein [Pseudomonas citronellolis]MDF3932195.1 AAA domain-containing protein [Pseudomonas citronellolis]
MFMLLLAGITLTATAVSWWNGKRLDDVQAQIEELEAELASIYAAHEHKSIALIRPYLIQLSALFDSELAIRTEIASELERAHARAQQILRQRFGARESASFRQMTLEIELARARIAAERTYLSRTAQYIRTLYDVLPAQIPTVAWIEMPEDYPCEGAIVTLSAGLPGRLHDYVIEADEFDGRGVFYAVDHQARCARISSDRMQLLDAALASNAEPLTATVVRLDGNAVELETLNATLRLPLGKKEGLWIKPGSELEVFADGWTLGDILGNSQSGGLPVRLHPRITGLEEYWWPVALGINEKQIPLIQKIWDYFQTPAIQDRPWHIYQKEDGYLVFQLGRYALVTDINSQQSCFRLKHVLELNETPEDVLRCYVALAPVLLGSTDEELERSNRFELFVCALNDERLGQRSAAQQRAVAMSLRKLSLVYREQQIHLSQSASCGFLPGRVEDSGRKVIGTLSMQGIPSWLKSALSEKGTPRLRAVGRNRIWPLQSFNLLDPQLGICEFTLVAPKRMSQSEINPFDLYRLELVKEGSQKETLSKALERAITGDFIAPNVHNALLSLDPEPRPALNLGHDAVMQALDSSEPVVAIWGPPGAGKTTTLVKWLKTLFPEDAPLQWPRILITGPTHVAVTKLIEDLLEAADYLRPVTVRYGKEDKISPPLLPNWHQTRLDGLSTGNAEINPQLHESWQALLRSRRGREAASRWSFRDKLIHGATCTGMARSDLALLKDPFDLVIVDEAGKAFAAELMIPAAMARRLVLVGDHNQLPPTVTADALDDRIGYTLPLEEVETLLRKNFFQELYDGLAPQAKGMLTVQYRMHEHIGNLVSELFYKKQLQSYRKGGEWTLTTARTLFVDFSNMQNYRHKKADSSDMASSLVNSTERAALYQLLKTLDQRVRAAGTPLELLIICPYKGQLEIVKRDIEGKPYAFNPNVATVDAVQGGQADMVILLMTRASGNVQFLLDRHRLNVALSRARDAVVILGHLDCLAHEGHGPVAELIKTGEAAKTLKVISLPADARFHKDLVPQVFSQP